MWSSFFVYTRCFIKRTPFSFFYNSLKWRSICIKFLLVVAEKILIQNILTKYGNWLNIFCEAWRNSDVIICHGYKLASPNWCCQLLPCSDGEKSGSLMTDFCSFTVLATKKQCRAIAFTCLEIAGLSNVRARQCTSTPSLQNGWIFGSRDTWFHVHMLLSAHTISIFY